MKELISIIIPVYNHAHTLERCFSSIQEQTYRSLEVIVVNDGSTDNFSEVMKNIKESITDFNIKIIEQENKGAAAARNVGFVESVGNYVIFWDADTVAKSRMLEKMKLSLDNHPEASYVYSQFCFGWKKMKSREFNADLLKKVNYIDTTSLIRRDGFVLFDELLQRFQDWDLWLTMLEKNKTGIFIPEVLFKKIIFGRKGYSSWLPSFFYKLPWKNKKIEDYEKYKKIILDKHKIKPA